MSLLFDIQGNRKYLTASERTAFLNAAETRSDDVRLFCKVLAYSGARISEVLALTPRQVDLAAGVVVIESLKKRRRGVFRAVPLPSIIFDELERVYTLSAARLDRAQSTQRIWKWCRTTAWQHVKGCMEEAGLKGRQTAPKGLRHSFGVCVLQAGIPINLVKKWLGHSRLTTTEIYADAVGAEEQAIAQRFWRTF